VARLALELPHATDIVHVHDWQVGLVPLLLEHERSVRGITIPGTVCTIHNLAYQGVFPSRDYELTNLPWDYFTSDGVEFYHKLNCLKAALVYSDELTTVSPRYAREITTEEYGCGLDGVLRARLPHLNGILNGVDYTEWNTTHNPFIKPPFSTEELEGKRVAKENLQKAMGLPVNPKVPLFGTVTRLAEQKGIDIQLAALEEMLAADMQFVLLGSGNAAFEEAFRRLASRHPSKVALKIGYDHALAHQIEAGSDFFIMPSRFEPCGLNQMYSLRYGAIPIVRVTGGLDDSVVDISENWEEADGIKFSEYSARALTKAIRKALVLYQHEDLLQFYRTNGMQKDFSWEHTAREYLVVYEAALAPKVTTPIPALAIPSV
jgi:starch synthase